jgi:toxin ParE1/3/4
MNRYRISALAKRDLEGIWDYIGITNDNPAAVRRQIELLHERFVLLAKRPRIGQLRDDLQPDLRFFPAGSYVILYYPVEDGIEVAGVIHGARDIEEMFRRGER